MNEKLLKQKAEEKFKTKPLGYEMKPELDIYTDGYIDGATEETKLLSEQIRKLQKTNSSLTDRVNELSNTLSTVCQERQELVDEYEKENREAREILKQVIQGYRNGVNASYLNPQYWELIDRAEQFLGDEK